VHGAPDWVRGGIDIDETVPEPPSGKTWVERDDGKEAGEQSEILFRGIGGALGVTRASKKSLPRKLTRIRKGNSLCGAKKKVVQLLRVLLEKTRSL